MKKAIIYGAGGVGKKVLENHLTDYEITAFIDSDSQKWGGQIDNISIHPPSDLSSLDFDTVIVGSSMGFREIQSQLLELGYSGHIENSYVSTIHFARIYFLKRFVENYHNNHYNDKLFAAEVGVYRGEFAFSINKYFNKNKLYLFDTFDGFDERDILIEQSEVNSKTLVGFNHFNNVNIDSVLKRMPNPKLITAFKGFFPDTAKELTDEKFIFVNLDVDLYAPTKSGLDFFSKRIDCQGIILIHDYYMSAYPGVKKAVDEFMIENKEKFNLLPIGDDTSVMICLKK